MYELNATKLTYRNLSVKHHPATCKECHYHAYSDYGIQRRAKDSAKLYHSKIFLPAVLASLFKLLKVLFLLRKCLDHADTGNALLHLVRQI